MLNLESITVNHDGAPGATQWRFEIYLNGSKVGTISEYKLSAREKSVSVNTADGVKWSPVPIPNATELDIRIVGLQLNSSVGAVGGAKWVGAKPPGSIKVDVKKDISLLGSFVFNFSIK